MKQGGKYDFDITEQVSWGDDFFRLNLGEATVTLSLKPERPKYLHFACSECSAVCEHVGAAFSLILEEKLSQGLSAPPAEKQPVESLSEEETEETLQMAESLKSRLSECLEKDQDGRLKMTITFPDESLLHNLAKSLAQILGSSGLRV